MEQIQKPKTQKDVRETIYMNKQFLGQFGSKLAFTVGSSYLFFGTLGFILGGVFHKKPLIKFPNKKLYVSYYLNQMTQKGLQYANNAGGAAFIYCTSGLLIQQFLDQENIRINQRRQNILSGMITGLIYKSTLGLQASLTGGLIGMGIIGGFQLINDELKKRNLSSIEMGFDN